MSVPFVLRGISAVKKLLSYCSCPLLVRRTVVRKNTIKTVRLQALVYDVRYYAHLRPRPPAIDVHVVRALSGNKSAPREASCVHVRQQVTISIRTASELQCPHPLLSEPGGHYPRSHRDPPKPPCPRSHRAPKPPD